MLKYLLEYLISILLDIHFRSGIAKSYGTFYNIFNGVELIYNILLVSGVQQSESIIQIHIPLFFRSCSHISHFRALSRVPRAAQQVLIGYLSYI